MRKHLNRQIKGGSTIININNNKSENWRIKRSKQNFGNIALLKRFQWYFEENERVHTFLRRVSQKNIKLK